MKAKVEITTGHILEHWKQGKSSLDWRSLTAKGKLEWLKACLHWSGLPKQKIPAFNFIIDGSQINSHQDYFCLLGEVFFGYRGYFGMDLHGWHDSFSEIYMNDKSKILIEEGAKVTLNNSAQMKEALADSFEEIVKGFKEKGFQVKFFD